MARRTQLRDAIPARPLVLTIVVAGVAAAAPVDVRAAAPVDVRAVAPVDVRAVAPVDVATAVRANARRRVPALALAIVAARAQVLAVVRQRDNAIRVAKVASSIAVMGVKTLVAATAIAPATTRAVVCARRRVRLWDMAAAVAPYAWELVSARVERRVSPTARARVRQRAKELPVS